MATGAMSYAFVKALTENPKQNYKELLNAVRQAMQEGGYTQKPQLSACHRECGARAKPAPAGRGRGRGVRRRSRVDCGTRGVNTLEGEESNTDGSHRHRPRLHRLRVGVRVGDADGNEKGKRPRVSESVGSGADEEWWIAAYTNRDIDSSMKSGHEGAA